MTRNGFYGRRMFAADLILVSVWTFFAWYTSRFGLALWALVILRIAASFQSYRQSHCAFLTSILFAIAYIAALLGYPSADIVIRPVEKMVYVAACLFGDTGEVVRMVEHDHWGSLRTLLYIAWGLWTAWLVLVPLAASWRLRGATRLIRLNRNGSLLQQFLRDRTLTAYVAIMALIMAASICGTNRICVNAAGFFLPIVLYRETLRLTGNAEVKTLPAMLFGLAGLCAAHVYDTPAEFAICMIIISLIAAAVAAALTVRINRSVMSGILLFAGTAIVIPSLLIGYNPFATPRGDYVTRFYGGCQGYRSGLFQYSVSDSKGWRMKSGLRDRYSVLVEPRYDRMEYIGRNKRFVVMTMEEDMIEGTPERIGIYDLVDRKEVISPDRHGVYGVTEIDKSVYTLSGETGEVLYTLILPGMVKGEYNPTLRLLRHPQAD